MAFCLWIVAGLYALPLSAIEDEDGEAKGLACR